MELVVKLEPIPLSENYSFASATGKNEPRYPVDLYMCATCGHVQQLDHVDPDDLWDNYTYESANSKGIPEHMEEVCGRVTKTYNPPKNALVVDVGSNDGSMLRAYKRMGYRVLGVDPATEIALQATRSGIPTIPALMSMDLAQEVREEHGPAHVLSAFNVFAHADNLSEIAEAIRYMMHDDGVFIFEAQYLLDILDGMLVATIFHEHMSHHSVGSMIRFLDLHDMELIEVERAPIQHGSIIGTVQRKGGKEPVGESVLTLLTLERDRKLMDLGTLYEWGYKLKRLRDRTEGLVAKWKQENACIAGFGAARSGPTLISQMGLRGSIDFIVDDHPQKVGKYSPGDGIYIFPTSELLKKMPKYTIILAWVHSDKIISDNQSYLANGGHFVVLCPETRVVGKDGEIPI